MEKSTKEQFYDFLGHILEEAYIPPSLENHSVVNANGKMPSVVDQ